MSYMRFVRCYGFVFFSLLILVVRCAWAGDYPSHPIQILVAYPAGGTTDIQARFLAKSMEKTLGQPVIVSNQPGVGGAIAAIAMKKAKADGYTIWYHSSGDLFFQPFYMEQVQKEKSPYQPEDFDYLAVCAKYQGAYCDLPDRSWKDWKGMMAEAKKRKGELTFGSMTPLVKMIFEIICKQEGVNCRIVPYKGGADVSAAILGGHADMGFLNGLQTKYLDTGKIKMRILASTMTSRLKSSPNVPTVEELGYQGVALDMDLLFLAPGGLPDDVRAKLGKAIAIAAKDPMFKDLVENKLLMEVVYVSDEEMPPYAAKKIQIHKSLIKQWLEK